jgi:hypothetical protein
MTNYNRDCRNCGRRINMREMPHGRWVAFEGDRPHKCDAPRPTTPPRRRPAPPPIQPVGPKEKPFTPNYPTVSEPIAAPEIPQPKPEVRPSIVAPPQSAGTARYPTPQEPRAPAPRAPQPSPIIPQPSTSAAPVGPSDTGILRHVRSFFGETLGMLLFVVFFPAFMAVLFSQMVLLGVTQVVFGGYIKKHQGNGSAVAKVTMFIGLALPVLIGIAVAIWEVVGVVAAIAGKPLYR